MLHTLLDIALFCLSLAGIAYSTIALWSARRYLVSRAPQEISGFTPPVSILKPLKGADSSTYPALRSHCLQDYPQYEIVFGVNDYGDPAVSVVRKLIAEFPQLSLRLVACNEVFGTNRKVSNLIHLLHEARHSYLLVNDGDISAPQNYLREAMSHFGDEKTGMVTCLYRGHAAGTIASRLEALGISTDFVPGVLTAKFLEGTLRFGLGSTLAMSRAALDAIGGFESVVEYLADDYQLGERIAEAGFKVMLSHAIVETSIPPYSLAQFWQHQMRWARTMRTSRPGGYAGMIFTFILLWAILLSLLEPARWWSWAILLASVAMRVAISLLIGRRVLQDNQLVPNLWLLPLRDLLAPLIWLCSFAGNEISWRGERFRVHKGKMFPVSQRDAATRDASSGSEFQRR
ncbi:MAG: bacteriohopanetetrol glucosamine biosynthesis glycosyltransferase HpnI [Acidobacteria bacterium]|nr:bacteriohopanetetrol glucosamine biosynthesis glycosyltransferase HpnI [Acidobacteriota bacterium]MBV9145733.1 bacteriohopanetetrol glucosamine biosynthesis glycosyltransferase HpnI [Acidobacteriota bacterium]